MRKRAQLAVGALMSVALLLNGCAADTEQAANTAETSVQTLIDAHDLAGMDAGEMIDHLDRVPLEERPTDLIASVMPDHLVLASATEETVLELPADQFYLSIAPFVNQTHECHYHSLTTCVGELSEQEVELTVTDDSGEVLVDEQRTTFDNGFVGVWVPAGSSGTIEITYDDKTGTTEFSTDDEAATCITDLQLT
ncbi:MAG TPA: CueP family metal-binding protein [Yaniella sp.]